MKYPKSAYLVSRGFAQNIVVRQCTVLAVDSAHGTADVTFKGWKFGAFRTVKIANLASTKARVLPLVATLVDALEGEISKPAADEKSAALNPVAGAAVG